MTFAIFLVLKATLLLCTLVALVLLLKKSSATLRHWLISLGMLCLLILPLVQYITPTIEVELPIAEIPILEQSFILINTENRVENTALDIPIQQNNYAIPNIIETPPTSTWQAPFSLYWKELIIGIWLLGVGFFLLKFLLGIFRIWRITKRATPFNTIPEISKLLPIRRQVQVLQSPDINTPMTWAFFQPKILLPISAKQWSEEEMRVVLLHELSHIKRNDYALHLLSMLTLSLYWWHPLVWLLHKWQQLEREKACDEYVLKLGISKTYYAEQLVQIARQIIQQPRSNWQASLPMAQSSQTKQRVLAILQFNLQHWKFTRWLQWRWLGTFACCLPLLAAIHPEARAAIEESIPKLEAALEQPIFEATLDENSPIKVHAIEFLPKRKVQITTPVEAINWAKKPNNNHKIAELSTLSKKPLVVSSSNTAPPLFNTRRETLPRYGTWSNTPGERVQIWTRGAFDISNETPYFTNLSEDALIIIEVESVEAKRTLVVHRAAYDGKSYSDPRQQRRSISMKGQTVFHWLVDDVFQSSVRYRKMKGFKKYLLTDDELNINFTLKDTLNYAPQIKLTTKDISEANWESDELPDWQMALQIARTEGIETSKLTKEDAIRLLGRVPIKTWDGYPNWASRLEGEVADIANKMLKASDNTWQNINPERPLSHWETMTYTYTTLLAKRLEPINRESRDIQEKILKNQTKIEVRKIKRYRKEHHILPEYPLPSVYKYIPSEFLYLTQTRKRVMPHFFMMETEVSNAYYREFLTEMQRDGKPENWDNIRVHNENWNREGINNSPYIETYHSHPAYDDYPVLNISYEGATAYCQWLTQKLTTLLQIEEGRLEVRLPTREEWMYAAHGGHIGAPFPWGGYYLRNSKGQKLCNYRSIDESNIKYDGKIDRYELTGVSDLVFVQDPWKHYSNFTAPGKSYFPNEYGLYNMSGNAAEMLLEKGSTKGGSWSTTGYYVNIRAEDPYAGETKPSPYIGFRPVVIVTEK